MYKKFYYADHESLNDLGKQADVDVYDALYPIIKKWIDAGYSSVELEHLVNAAAGYTICMARTLRAQSLLKRKNKP